MKKVKLISLSFLVVLTAMLTGCSKNSGDVLMSQILSQNVVKVAVSADDAPYSYQKRSNSDEYDGIEVKIAEQLAQGLGVELELVPTDRANLLQTLTDGTAQLAIGRLQSTLAEQSGMAASIAYMSGNIYTVTKRGVTISTKGAMEGKVILCSDELSVDSKYQFDNIKDSTIIENDGSVDIESYLLDGLLDAYICYKDEAEVMIKNDKLQAQVATNIAAEDYSVFTAQDNEKLLKAVNEMIDQMLDNNIIEEIVSSF